MIGPIGKRLIVWSGIVLSTAIYVSFASVLFPDLGAKLGGDDWMPEIVVLSIISVGFFVNLLVGSWGYRWIYSD